MTIHCPRSLTASLLVVGCVATSACDKPAVSPNVALDDAQLQFREVAFDCEQWRATRDIQHPTEHDVDIDLDFAELAFDNGFADLRACEHAMYDQEHDGDWIIHDTEEGDVTYAMGLRNGDRNVRLRPIDPDTGEPTGRWVPLAFPEISPESLLELYGSTEFELSVEREVGARTSRVHLR